MTTKVQKIHKLSPAEQELLIRCDRESDTAVCLVPVRGYVSWINLFTKAGKKFGVVGRKITHDGEIVAYEFQFPKAWIQRPKQLKV